MGGMAWFAIPFAMASSMGLAARALDLPLTSDEANKGLVPPAVAVHMFGRAGAVLIACQVGIRDSPPAFCSCLKDGSKLQVFRM
jgi:hypothetical protein